MKWLTLVFVVFIAYIIVAADRSQLPGFIVALYNFPQGDKVGHFLLFGILTCLLGLAVPLAPAPRPWLSLVLAGALLAALVGAEEFSQSFFASRHATWTDLASSYTGILCFTSLAWARRRQAVRAAQSGPDKETPRA